MWITLSFFFRVSCFLFFPLRIMWLFFFLPWDAFSLDVVVVLWLFCCWWWLVYGVFLINSPMSDTFSRVSRTCGAPVAQE